MKKILLCVMAMAVVTMFYSCKQNSNVCRIQGVVNGEQENYHSEDNSEKRPCYSVLRRTDKNCTDMTERKEKHNEKT